MKNILKVLNKESKSFHVILGDTKYSYTNTIESFVGYLISKGNKRTEYGNATRQDRFFANTNLGQFEVEYLGTNIKDEDALRIKKEIIQNNGRCDSQFSSKL